MVSDLPVAKQAAAALADRTGVARHDVAVVLGSGWGEAADLIGEPAAEMPLADLLRPVNAGAPTATATATAAAAAMSAASAPIRTSRSLPVPPATAFSSTHPIRHCTVWEVNRLTPFPFMSGMKSWITS